MRGLILLPRHIAGIIVEPSARAPIRVYLQICLYLTTRVTRSQESLRSR